jgi:tellurite resistance protein
MTAPRVPLNFFGMPFGLAGLAVTWLTMADDRRAPQAVGDALLAVALVAWLLVLVGYLRYVLSVRSALVRDLLDPVAAPFASLALITPMLLAVDGVTRSDCLATERPEPVAQKGTARPRALCLG